MPETPSRSGRARTALAVGAAFVLSSCRAFAPPTEELRAVLEQGQPMPDSVRRTAWSRIESKWFSGEFRALIVEQRGPSPRIRFQLLPDLGGKLLDLVVTPTAIAGYWPHTGVAIRETHGAGGPAPARGLVGFLGVTLLENAAPLRFERVLAVRREDGDWLLRIEPVIAGGHTHVEVRLGGDGALKARRYTHAGVSWREEFSPEHRIVSKDFEWVLRGETEHPIDAPPSDLFDLELASGMEP